MVIVLLQRSQLLGEEMTVEVLTRHHLFQTIRDAFFRASLIAFFYFLHDVVES